MIQAVFERLEVLVGFVFEGPRSMHLCLLKPLLIALLVHSNR